MEIQVPSPAGPAILELPNAALAALTAEQRKTIGDDEVLGVEQMKGLVGAAFHLFSTTCSRLLPMNAASGTQGQAPQNPGQRGRAGSNGGRSERTAETALTALKASFYTQRRPLVWDLEAEDDLLPLTAEVRALGTSMRQARASPNHDGTRPPSHRVATRGVHIL